MYDEKQMVCMRNEDGINIDDFVNALEDIKWKNPGAKVCICGDDDIYFHVEKDGSVINIDNDPLSDCYPDRSMNEFVGQIIDIFEDFLDSKKIVLENDEKEDSGESVANIYGTDYGTIQMELEGLLDNWKLVETDEQTMAKDIISK